MIQISNKDWKLKIHPTQIDQYKIKTKDCDFSFIMITLVNNENYNKN